LVYANAGLKRKDPAILTEEEFSRFKRVETHNRREKKHFDMDTHHNNIKRGYT
jgi:hypothetical protein